MSSAFNLSTLVAMQDQRVERASVHFWRCQLTSEKPRFAWNPDAKAPTGEEAADGGKDQDKGKENDAASEEGDEDDGDITTRHVLHVTGCVLGPKAEGIHLVTVRTRSYQKQQQPPTATATEPDACPILCVDPASQRTLTLGHEFVLEHMPTAAQPQPTSSKTAGDSSSCVFELAEGSGPVWLTGTHRVHRVVPASGAGDLEEEEEEEEEASENEEEEAGAEDEEEDIAEESEEDDDEELIEEVKPVKKGRGRQLAVAAKPKQSKAAAAASAGNGKQQQQRKRAKPDS